MKDEMIKVRTGAEAETEMGTTDGEAETIDHGRETRAGTNPTSLMIPLGNNGGPGRIRYPLRTVHGSRLLRGNRRGKMSGTKDSPIDQVGTGKSGRKMLVTASIKSKIIIVTGENVAVSK